MLGRPVLRRVVVPIVVAFSAILAVASASYAAPATHHLISSPNPPLVPPGYQVIATFQDRPPSGGVSPNISDGGTICYVSAQQGKVPYLAYSAQAESLVNCSGEVREIDQQLLAQYCTAWNNGRCVVWEDQGQLQFGYCSVTFTTGEYCPPGSYAYWDLIPPGTEYTTQLEACVEFNDGYYPCTSPYLVPYLFY